MAFSTIFRRATCLTCSKYYYTSIISRSVNTRTTYTSDFIEEIDSQNEEYEFIANKCFTNTEQNCFIIHPYVKWGPKKIRDTSVKTELFEAVSLINTLTGWKTTDKVVVPTENMDKKTLFGSGTLEKLKLQIRQNIITTSVFINVGTLKNKQLNELELIFGVPIVDRYKIVMQILRQHAVTKHAKLQVALAEIPYLRSRLKYLDISTSTNWKTRDKMLLEREQKLKTALKKLRNQRELLRNKRNNLDFPVVAVVGYTNVGKTSLIKCLTGDESLSPKNQLFATLDVTMHAGLLPSKLEVLFVDTVGFITNIPTNLIECFIATLEDAMLADVIIHVQDVSNKNMLYQKKHVDSVLQSLSSKINNETLSNKIICVGNKCDAIVATEHDTHNDLILVSAKTLTGLNHLKHRIETTILRLTGRHMVTLRVPTGGDETRWLYKNATIVQQNEDDEDSQYQVMKIIITETKLKQFNSYFVIRQ